MMCNQLWHSHRLRRDHTTTVSGYGIIIIFAVITLVFLHTYL